MCEASCASAGIARARGLRFHHLGIGGQRADDQAVALLADPLELGDPAQIDDVGRRGEPLLERRDQGVAAGQKLAVGRALEQRDRLGDGLRTMVLERVHDLFLPIPPPAASGRSCSARQTFSGVAGIEMRTPIASVIAFITAGGAPIAPASPQPLTPSVLWVQGVSVSATWKLGTLSALGMQ